MNNWMVKAGIVMALFGVTTGAALAGPPAATKCPVCKMTLSSKKTAANPTAVKLTKKGKTMYCCAGCKMPASVLVKK